jgi:G:T-mismatch repair DNA endonuclease (very short patch repair protein)
VSRELQKRSWSVIRVWEYELKEPRKVAARVRRVYET